MRNPLTQKQLDEQYKNFSKYEFDNVASVVQGGYARRCAEQKSFIENSLDDSCYKSILEVGAASGYNLSLYKNKDTMGIEPSKINCENAKTLYGIEMFAGTFEEYIKDNSSRKFDMLFLSHTLEHIVNPLDFIRQCASINNAYFFIEVPSFDYKLRDEPFGMFTDEHVNMFTFESLQNCMNAAGYSIVNADIPFCVGEVAPSGYPALRTLWKKDNAIKRIEPIFTSKVLFKNYLDWSEKQIKVVQKKIREIPSSAKVAVWGIGNTAARILGSTALEKKNVIRAYDSDRRKWNLEFAGAKISGFDKNDIEKGLVDTVIITTCTAQRTLLKILEPYRNKLRLVTLFDV